MRSDAQIQHDVYEHLKWDPRVTETDIGVAAVQVAVASIDEAEQAMLEAIAARLDADAVPVG